MNSTLPDDVKRILVVLAALKLKSSELSALMRYLRGITPHDFISVIKNIEVEVFDKRNDSNREESQDLLANSTNEIALDQVIQLLKDELKLSNKDLASALIAELSQNNALKNLNIRSFDGKKSLALWLSQINRQVGASELLRAATKVRNALTHQQKGPWSLERDGE